MARITFEIDDQTKREVKIRSVREGQTLSGIMRAFCLYYRDFGFPDLPDSLDTSLDTLAETNGDPQEERGHG